jgi:hypothetical protein
MRKASAKVSLDMFRKDLFAYEQLLQKVYADATHLTLPEKRAIYEAFVLKICAIWEALVENLLVDCLNQDSRQYSSFINTSLPKHIPREICSAMVTGINYFNFKSVEEVQKIARKVLVDRHNPFKAISNSNSKRIDEFFKMRNYLTHLSGQAERTLNQIYKKNYGMSKWSDPGPFLLALDKKTNRSRLQNYVDVFKATIQDLAKALAIS